ncbi:hypothetical protein IP97_02527 [Flavobacterium cheniae]|uniref:Uncharacterized protein n=2 Tax=Flavobacterium cheniae TaxID=295428 RepID=A0A562KA50_9FLAO|nr:hypothetical protein C8D80_2530 [Flavobacterium cheniae]TWH92085.1 hypothetical protein IP97_02527 [Flavobacterium cheniae]
MDYKNIIIGIFFLIIGIYTIIDTYKKPDSQLITRTLGGYIGGIGAIVIGIMLVFGIKHL